MFRNPGQARRSRAAGARARNGRPCGDGAGFPHLAGRRACSVSQWWKDLIAAYEKKYPDVKINMQQVPFAQFVKQMTVRFAAGTPPDIVHLPSRDFASFADQGWLEPLDARLKPTDILTTWTPLQSEMVWDGKQQGVLLMGYGGMLFYNEQLLKDAHVALPKNAGAVAGRDESKPPIKLAREHFGLATITAEHPNMVVEMASWVIGSGADWLKGGRYNLTDPAVVKASRRLAAIGGLCPEGGRDSAQARQLFIDGKGRFPARRVPGCGGAVEKGTRGCATRAENRCVALFR